MPVPRGTTPTFILMFEEEYLDFRKVKNVYVTFKSGLHTLTKKGSDLVLNEKTIDVYLNQSETRQFRPGKVEIQANWTDDAGNRAASEIVDYPVMKNLLEAVIE